VLYEPPEDHESYIHRAGRTGRAGASGEVISLVDIMQKLELGRIAKHYQIDMQMRPTPTDEDVAKVATERMTAMLEAKLRSRSPLQRERMQRFMPMVRQMAEDEEQMKLVAMLIDELYQDSLHAAPPAPSAEEHRQRPAARPAPRTAPAPRPQQAAAGNEQQDSDPRPKRRRRRRKPASSE